ncbi:MAG TPA: TadE/TadG family type IV pilus assembly protein [Bryobacteraceae bacterium]|nr:TadE/TadG family type IV pilus assembly protein [Bryobacteraceae bacterium]
MDTSNRFAANLPGTLRRCSARRTDRGFSLVLLAVSAFVMIGMLGLAIDLGKIFITKNELQTFSDASALAAVTFLDGSKAGVEAANSAALAGPLGSTTPNGYDLDTKAIANATVTYATDFSGTYDSFATADGSPTNNYRFIRVTAAATAPLNFLPVIQGIPTSLSLSASAVAGQEALNNISNGGLLPFAPDAHNPADTQHFGWTPGSEYTLKWGKGKNGDYTTCAGDVSFTPFGNAPSEHGFVDIGEGNSNNNVRASITSGGYPNANSNPSSLATGNTLSGVPGNRGTSIFDALQARMNQDTDTTSTTWAHYQASGTGNGRRVVTVAVAGMWVGNGANANTPILGFANFFLETTYSGTDGPICAIYIGPGNLTGNGSGAMDATKVYTDVLYQ